MNFTDEFAVDDHAPTCMSRQRKMRNNYIEVPSEMDEKMEPMTDEISN